MSKYNTNSSQGLSNPTQQCFRNEIIAKDTYSKPKHYSAFIKKYEKKVFDKIYSNSIECPLCFLVRKKDLQPDLPINNKL